MMHRMKQLILLLLVSVVVLVVMSGCSTTKNTSVKNNASCQSDEDCNILDCSAHQNQLPRAYGICEYGTCICGCGDPENGKYCR